jgi:hypothetical protein
MHRTQLFNDKTMGENYPSKQQAKQWFVINRKVNLL